MKRIICFAVSSCFLLSAFPVKAGDELDNLKPYLTPNTIAVMELDAKEFFENKTVQEDLRKISTAYYPSGKSEDSVELLRDYFKNAGQKKIYAVFDVTMINSSFPFYVIPVDSENQERLKKPLEQSHYFLHLSEVFKVSRESNEYRVFPVKNGLVASRRNDEKRIKNIQKYERQDITEKLEQNQESLMTLVVSPTMLHKRILEEQLSVMPGSLSEIPKGMLIKNLQSVVFQIDPSGKKTKIRINGSDEQGGQELLEFIKMVYQDLERNQKDSRSVSLLRKYFIPLQNGNTLNVDIDLKSPEGELIREQIDLINDQYFGLARRKVTMNRFKQILLAFHNYHYRENDSSFPPQAILSKDGKPLLSWRVAILPFVDEKNLYDQFHLDEPWDSEHNKKLIPQMPTVYFSPVSKVNYEHKTTFLSLAGEKMVMGSPKGTQFREMIDGTSNTIVLVDVADKNAVIWTKPDDFVPGENPYDGLSGHFPDGFVSAFGDGSAKFISKKLAPSFIQSLFTMNGGEIIDWRAEMQKVTQPSPDEAKE